MSLLTVSPSVRTAELTTRPQILKKWCDDSGGLGDYGTATSGATTFLIDTTLLLSARFSPEEYENCYLYMSSGANVGMIRPVNRFVPEEGRVQWDTPATGGAIAAGDEYFLFKAPHPQRILNYIDTILTEDLYQPTFAFCGEAPDMDMEQALTTGDWTAVNATPNKVTAEPILTGARQMSVLATAAEGYVKNKNPFYVEPGKGFHLSTAVRTDGVTNATLRAWDATNGVLIAEVTTNRPQWVRLFIDLTIPSTCHSLETRLVTVSNGQTTYWDDLLFFPLGMKQLSLPWWVRHRDQVKKVFRLSPEKFADTQHWLASFQGSSETGWDAVDDMMNGRHYLMSRVTTTQLPLYILGVRNETAYASNTETKHVNLNWIVSQLGERIYTGLGGWASAGTMDTKWIEAQRKEWAAKAKSERYRAATRAEEIFQAAETSTLHYRRDY